MALLPWSLLLRKIEEESQPACHEPVVMETDGLGFITMLLFSRYDVAVETQSPKPRRTPVSDLSYFIYLFTSH